jgi:hypothetical protein
MTRQWLCSFFKWFPLRPDVMELVIETEMCFDTVFHRKDFPWMDAAEHKSDLTAGELHDWVCQQLRLENKPVPPSSWHRIQHLLADLTGTPPALIRHGSYVQKDLRYFEGG